jgi:hypothetical protein
MEGRVLRDERARQKGTAVTEEGEELETGATCAEDKRDDGEPLETDATGDENEKELGEGDRKGEELDTTATGDEDKREEEGKLETDATGDENEKEQGEGDRKGETFKRIQGDRMGTRSLECDPSSDPAYSTVLAV